MNKESPDLEAVRISPKPLLLTTIDAKEVFPATEATGVMPERSEPYTWNLADAVDEPPTRRSPVISIG